MKSSNLHLDSLIDSVKKEMNQLATEDVSTVGQNLTKLVAREMKDNPYETLASAVVLGIGLAHMNSMHLRSGLIHFAKLIGMRALSNLEAPKSQEKSNAVSAA
jgi:hypothetical protein